MVRSQEEVGHSNLYNVVDYEELRDFLAFLSFLHLYSSAVVVGYLLDKSPISKTIFTYGF